jgi:branched-chain amino acid transport system ATP-binding protein
LLRPKSGTIRYHGNDITRCPPHRVVKQGLSHVPEGRMVFANLTVRENLQLGAFLRNDRAGIIADMDFVFGIFPRLKEREAQVAGTLSGGEQQMLAIARALMSKPSFLMLDEPSLGIAPILVKTIFEKIVEINKQQGITMLLVEQNANLALEISDYAYVLETGRISLQDKSAGAAVESGGEEGVFGWLIAKSQSGRSKMKAARVNRIPPIRRLHPQRTLGIARMRASV